MSTHRDARPEFEEFVAVCSGRLLRTAYLLTRDPALAEDLLQDALARTWFAWNRLDDQPEPFARTTMASSYVTWWRRRWRARARPAEQPAGTEPGTGTDQDLWVALGRLSRRQRAVVVLRFFDELSEADTAEALGLPAGTVRSLTSKALARLRVDPVTRDGPAQTWEPA